MRERIDAARQEGTTLGGDVEVRIEGLPPGLGSYAQWDTRLDGLLAQAVMSVQAVKAVSFGAGAMGGDVPGHEFHDAIVLTDEATPAVDRPTNRGRRTRSRGHQRPATDDSCGDETDFNDAQGVAQHQPEDRNRRTRAL